MKLRYVLGASAVLLGAALPAWAFQEQSVGVPPAQTEQAPAQPEPGSGAKPIDMQLSPEEANRPVEGTEVRIPGLGKLGVLPKMDFGLELLYGANDGRPAAPVPDDIPTDDDLRIRGTMKHNF
jgi:hypothetical protein